MRPILAGLVAGACVSVFAIAALGAASGYSHPEGYPPGLFPGLPRPAAACLWALAYFGPLAGAAGGLVGGGIGAVVTVLRRARCRRTGRRQLEGATMTGYQLAVGVSWSSAVRPCSCTHGGPGDWPAAGGL
jgi:hypothetical protein